MSKKKKQKLKRKKAKNIFLNFAGTAVIYIMAYITIPKAIPLISEKVNKIITKSSKINSQEDDWGPIIEKIHHD